ncbi:phage baseplate assembly protein V [Myxococcota bacterium]|nr:phage baseplate assembly protein V [Myxococcota bacterium]
MWSTRDATAHRGFAPVPVAEGLVVDNRDPEGLGRVQVSLPRLGDRCRTDWARICTPMAGPDRGWVSLPEPGDEVLVAFLHGDPEQPVVLGGLHGGRDRAPYANADGANDLRVFRSRAGHTVTFDDASAGGGLTVETGGGAVRIRLDAATGAVTVEARGDVTLRAGATLRLEARTVEVEATDLSVRADASIRARASTALDLEAGARITARAPSVDLG